MIANHPQLSSKQFTLGGDLTVNRLGYGAMHLTGYGMWARRKTRKTRSAYCAMPCTTSASISCLC